MSRMEREDVVTSHDDEAAGGRGREDGEEQEWLLGAKLRRGIAVGKRGGVCTPVPSWKLGASPCGGGDNPSRASARKLGANLWEIQDLLPAREMSKREGKGRDLVDLAAQRPHDRGTGTLRRHVATSLVQCHKAACRDEQGLQPASPGSFSDSLEIAAYNLSMTPSLNIKEKVRDSGYALKTSSELLKVLNRIWSLEEQNASNVSVVKALKLELASAREQIKGLVEQQQGDRQEIDDLVKQLTEDKLTRKSREKERVRVAVQSVKDELAEERRLRRNSESLHRNSAKELREVKTLYSKTMKCLERERKGRMLLENLCDEFAKGIGDYEKEVRQLKQKQEKDFNPICDRLVLHVSEAWLDERLQLKLAESRGDFIERDLIIERLECEVAAFLHARPSECSGSDVGILVQSKAMKDNYLRRQSLESLYLHGAVSAPQYAEDEDSIASDLHCFELNMRTDGNEPRLSDATKSETFISHFARMRNGKIEMIQDHGSSIIHKFDDNDKAISASNNKNKAIFVDEKERAYISPKPNVRNDPRCIMEMTESEPLAAVTQDSGVNMDVIRTKWNNMHCENDNSHKGQSSLKVHPEDDTSNLTCSKGKHVLGGSHDFPTDYTYRYGSCSTPHQGILLASPESKHIESLELPLGVGENTLKAKLLEARLEGQQARLRTSKGFHLGG